MTRPRPQRFPRLLGRFLAVVMILEIALLPVHVALSAHHGIAGALSEALAGLAHGHAHPHEAHADLRRDESRTQSPTGESVESDGGHDHLEDLSKLSTADGTATHLAVSLPPRRMECVRTLDLVSVRCTAQQGPRAPPDRTPAAPRGPPALV